MDLDLQNQSDIDNKSCLGNRAWRLNNLYTIQDILGKQVRFSLNPVQQDLEENLHTRNLVLKSRKHGITTWACIRALDMCLFKEGQTAGLVFHKNEEAVKAFTTKIIYAYDRLPWWLRAELPVVKRDMSGLIQFENGSRIEVSLSHRGGTLQYLHISEYGPMVAMFPKRAEEVASGALNTLAPEDTIITIESTAMGAWGDYYDRCQRAMVQDRMIEAGAAVRTSMDYRLHFYGWWQDPRNRMNPDGVPIPDKLSTYFDQLETMYQCRIFPGQRAWYLKKSEEQKDKMKREHPSTPKEAFEGSVEGAYYAVELAKIEADGRICDLPYIPTLPVYTFWDIGRNDSTAIWLAQVVGPWVNFIGYYENAHHGSSHYTNYLRTLKNEKGYQYGCHYLPHDAKVSDWSVSENKTRKEVIEDARIGPVTVVERIESLSDGIEMTRQFLARCRFDRKECGEYPVGSGRGGLPALRAYIKSFDERAQVWSDTPMKNWARHGADAIRQAAQGFSAEDASDIPRPPKKSKRSDRVRSAMTA